MQISRLFEIVYLLMHQEQTTAKELAARFEISQRTVYRDIEALCQAGIPIYTAKGKGGGIRLMDGYVLNKSVLSEEEQMEILSALHGLQNIPYGAAQPLLDKLGALFHTPNTDWIEVDFTNWSDRAEEQERFHLLKHSILNRQVVCFDYYSSKGELTHRRVEPLKIVFKGQAWYLLGFCLDKQDTRFFKLSRIHHLSLSGTFFDHRSANVPVMPNWEYHPTRIEVLLKFDSAAAFRVCDEIPRDDVTIQSDGSITAHMSLPEDWIYQYLMTFGEQVEVLHPISVRNALRQKHRNAAEKNR